jgi:hypothetical protein
MKKPKQRYTHPGQIEVEIDKARKRAGDLLKSAAELERIGHGQIRNGGEWMVEQGNHNLGKADKLRVTATNLLDGRIKMLSGKLAELNTQPLKGIITDASVEA